MPHCRLCATLPFHDLPNEEDEALSHQPTLDALSESAKSCTLCKLILWAAGCSLRSPGGIITYMSPSELPDGRKVDKRVWNGNYNNTGMMRGLSCGAAMIDTGNAQADLAEPLSVDLRARFPAGSNIRPWLFGNWYRSPYQDRSPLLVGLGVRLGTGPWMEEAEGNSTINNTIHMDIKGTYLRIRTDDNSDLSDIVPGRLRTDFQGSEIAFQRVHKWVEDCTRGHDCDKNHSCDKNRGSPTVPTRLLDVSESGESIRIVELGEDREHYIALSHCWGLSHRITTTKENIAKHREGIPIRQLPATFRQAVFIARELDIRYLWIDSLCIIQDDFPDWEHEASRMGNVYAHAYLTISALSTADDSSGCFRNGSDIKAVSIEQPHISCDSWTTGFRAIPLAAPLIGANRGDEVDLRVFREIAMRGDARSRVYVTCEWMPPSLKDNPRDYLVGRFGRKVDPFEHEPLNKRAWTLQERLLSPRTLHYGSQEMYWECQCCVLCEDGALLTREFPTLNKVLASWSASEKDESRHDRWYKLVEEYTGRNLTRDQDKLPALSGLANLMAAKTGDVYVAGLWKRDVIKDLFWSVEIVEPSHYCDNPEHDAAMPPATKASVKHPTQYRAPSWSWASLDGKVKYWHLNEAAIKARCLDVQVPPAGKDKFGRVQLGWMTIKAPMYLLRPLEWSEERYKRVFKFTILVELSKGTGKQGLVNGHANFDDEAYFPSFALMLDNEHAIILKANGVRKFTRIGIVSSIGKGVVEERARSAELNEQGKRENEKLAYSVEDAQAAEIANGSQQIVTIF